MKQSTQLYVKPDITLPATVTGYREIVEYDEISGKWKGMAFRETKDGVSKESDVSKKKI